MGSICICRHIDDDDNIYMCIPLLAFIVVVYDNYLNMCAVCGDIFFKMFQKYEHTAVKNIYNIEYIFDILIYNKCTRILIFYFYS